MKIIAKLLSLETKLTTKGSEYGFGELKYKINDSFKIIQFKVWESLLLPSLNTSDFFELDVTEDSYQGKISFKINTVTQTSGDNFYSISKEKLEEKIKLQKRMKTILDKYLSESGSNFIKEFFNKDLYNRFSTEQAAIKMHDANPVGLLNHTVKMLEILDLSLTHQNNYNLNQNGLDLIVIGLLLHDIGKTKEYLNGEKTKYYKATHRGLGIEIIVLNRDLILKHFHEDFYYELISIINQHHGIFEERPHTIFSYLVHLVDMFDTHSTSLNESISNNMDKDEIRVIDKDIPTLEKNKIYFN